MTMWNAISNILFNILTYGIFFYSVLLVVSYLFIGIYSIGETRKYLHRNNFTDYRLLAASPHAPSVSILAPAYNEGKTIVENVRSLLSIYYSNLEVIILNDGSKDDSLQKLIEAYQLEKVDFFVNYQIKTKEVRGVYKSKIPVYHKLVVVDKVNGGKADALNVGINIASYNYLVCIDVDCVLEQDALLKMVKPFMEQTTERVIASGGVVRIANSCIVEDGRLVKVKLPDDYLPRVQSLEYIRAFILGRMAWSRLNGLMLISGAFGAFDKEIVIKCGGYNHNTVGEDMELVVRMRRYMEEQRQPYKVTYIPDPLCWTEAPASYKILGRQRNRWTRGTYETLTFHRVMFFNPKYHLLGMLSYPYWFFFELCAPIIEFFGFICFFLFAILGLIDWSFFAIYLLFIIMFGYTYSVFAIYMEVITYNMYKKRTEIFRLILTALSEPFYFHAFVVWSAIKGYIDLIRKNKGWGEMTRQGFRPQAAPAPVATTVATPGAPAATEATVVTETTSSRLQPVINFVQRIPLLLWQGLKTYTGYMVIFLALLVGASILEWIWDIVKYGMPEQPGKIVVYGLAKDLAFFLQTVLVCFPPFALLYLLHARAAKVFFTLVAVVLILVQLSLTQYFLKTLVPLGADLWSYSWADIKQTVGAAGGIPVSTILTSLLAIGIIILAFIYLPQRARLRGFATFVTFILITAAFLLGFTHQADTWKPGKEFSNNLALNKAQFFIGASYDHFFPKPQYPDIYADGYLAEPVAGNIQAFHYIDETHYPFLHTTDSSTEVLSPFFNSAATPPNIVIILVEGLGRAFTNKGGYLGNFTPFVDSLAGQSLYWENCLSEGGRTFAVLPSFTASLPFAQNGFAELKDQMPPQFSLLNILTHNGYHTSFYYGGDSKFDYMNLFLQKNSIGTIHDEATFPPGYTKLPEQNGFTWGYEDKELFRHYFDTQQQPKQPYCNILLTVSTHNPFLINDQQAYLQRFEQRMNELGFDENRKQNARNYRYQFASILYTDDALRAFFTNYARRPDYKNTVFIITGDHRMPEIPMTSKIDRYHVPLIIYSPLLARTAVFSSVSTHFDVTPSLLQWLKKSYQLSVPDTVCWMGSGLDTARAFRNIHAYPLMQTKTDLVDFVMGDHLLNGNDLYKISNRMNLEPITDDTLLAQMKASFNRFREKNRQFITANKLLPDSLLQQYHP